MVEIGQLTRLNLGYVGETGSRQIEIDVSAWLQRWPEGAVAINVRRPDGSFYLAATETEDGMLSWVVNASDVAVGGHGMAQVIIYGVETGTVYKSRTVETIIRASIDEALDEDAPDPMETWVAHAAIEADRATQARIGAEEAKEAATEAKEAAETAAEDAETERQTAEEASRQAQDAADAATESAEEAAGSATKAAEYEALADAQREVAAKKATEAETSANTAKTYAQEAEASALEADEKAQAAAEHAETAEGSAQEAAAYAGEAKAAAEMAAMVELSSASAIVTEASGAVATIADAAARDAQGLVTTITPDQAGTGTPSPTNVRVISARDKISLYHGEAYDESAAATLTATLPEGVYGGTLDWLTGVLTVTHEAITYDGTEEWTFASTNAVCSLKNMPARLQIGNQEAHHVCSHYRSRVYAAGASQTDKSCYTLNTTTLMVKDTSLTSLEDWKAYLAAQAAAGTPMTIVWKLKSARYTTIQLTPQQLALLKGGNAIWSDAGGTAVTYVADTKLYIDNALAAIAASIIA